MVKLAKTCPLFTVGVSLIETVAFPLQFEQGGGQTIISVIPIGGHLILPQLGVMFTV